jgi:hypothetical protein
VDDQGRLDIGDYTRGADGIKIALNKFAESAILRGLPPPYWSDVITLEGGTKLVDVLSGKPSQRYRKIESHTDGSPPGIGEVVHLPVGLLRAFACEDFEVFQCRRIDR